MNNITLIPNAILVEGKMIYMFSRDYNLLYCYDTEKKETSLLGSIPEEYFFVDNLCAKMFLHDGCLFLVPLKSRKIWKYNIKADKWRGFEFNMLIDKDKYKFYQAIKRDNEIIMIGCYYPSILTFNLSTEEIKYHSGPFGYFSDCTSDDSFFRVDYAKQGDAIYLASCKTNVVVKLNIDSYESECYRVGRDNNTYSGIAYDGKNFWLSPRSSHSIVRWDGDKKSEEYDLSDTLPPYIYNFWGIIYHDDSVILPACMANSSIRVNCSSVEIEYMEKKYNYLECDGNELVECSMDGDISISRYNVTFSCVISGGVLSEYLSRIPIVVDPERSLLQYENEIIDLQMFIDFYVD